ncbi:unnamed protein product, partial [marine sediment metagenome]
IFIPSVPNQKGRITFPGKSKGFGKGYLGYPHVNTDTKGAYGD